MLSGTLERGEGWVHKLKKDKKFIWGGYASMNLGHTS